MSVVLTKEERIVNIRMKAANVHGQEPGSAANLSVKLSLKFSV